MQGLVQVSEQDWGYLLRMSRVIGHPTPSEADTLSKQNVV